MQMLETSELVAFTRTVDAKSLSRASAELRIPRPTLTRRLDRLEEKLGVRLLRRSTRSLVLTDAGQALYRHARIMIEAAEAAEASVRRAEGELSGDLRVTLPHADADLQDTIAEFIATHTGVRVQLHVSSRVVDLRREGYDVAIRATGELEPGLVARRLFRTALVAVASPAYLRAHPAPRSVRDLRAHRCLMGLARSELPQTHWTIGSRKIRVDGAAFSNSPALLLRLAIRGLGIALVPQSIASSAIARGELVRVLPKVLRTEGSISLVYVDRELMPPQVRAFVEWIVSRHGPARSLRGAEQRA